MMQRDAFLLLIADLEHRMTLNRSNPPCNNEWRHFALKIMPPCDVSGSLFRPCNGVVPSTLYLCGQHWDLWNAEPDPCRFSDVPTSMQQQGKHEEFSLRFKLCLKSRYSL